MSSSRSVFRRRQVEAPSADARPSDVAVVRQPISDGRHSVVGYEVLVGGNGRVIQPGQDVRATSALLVDAFGDIGLERLAGSHPVWLAMSPAFLVEVGSPPVRPDRAVLQLPAEPVGDDVLAVLQQLARTGYTLALDRFDAEEDLGDLLALCSIVKVDVTGRSDNELRAIATAGTAQGALLTAVRVEDPAAFERCLHLGFTYFQGSFFAQPRLVRQQGLASAGIGSLRAMGELMAADVSFEELERIIAADVGLSLKLLRYVNSAFFALPRNIGSIREALTMLGVRTVRRWATVISMSSVQDAPSELIGLALHRARMCELLAGGESAAEKERCFTVGMFSVADALTGAPMEEVLESLPFDDEVRGALLRHEGPKGELLAALLAYERGEFPALPAALQTGGATLATAYREALEWADDASRAVGD